MTRLDREPAIVRMAHELKADINDGAVAGIVRYCKRKLGNWIQHAGAAPASVRELEQLVCRNLKLVFEEVWIDADLDSVIRKYADLGEFVFTALRTDLDDTTFAALIERQHVAPDGVDRYVAVVDCRGDKSFRRFFTKWHEIAHLMTLTRQLELPFHRSTNRSPTERLMDLVGAEIGFHEPLLSAAIAHEHQQCSSLTFATADRTRNTVFPEASFAATLNACVSHWPSAVLLVEVGMGLKKSERERLESRQLALLPAAPPTAKLRILSVASSERARVTRFRLDPHMSVPCESGLYVRFEQEDAAAMPGSWTEDLSIWRHSDGVPVGQGLVRFESRRNGDALFALVQPARARAS